MVVEWDDGRPRRAHRCGVGVAAAQDEDVGDDVGARRGGEGPRREPDGADEVGQGRHLAPGRGVAGVEGVAGGEGGDHAAGPGELQALDEEVVVQPVAGAVAAGVVWDDVGERDVADDEVEVVVRLVRLEGHCVDDGGVGVEVRGDAGGRRVELDPGHVRAGRSEPDEVAGAASRFEDVAAVEPEGGDRVPHGRDDAGVGVVGVEGCPPRCLPLGVVEQAPELVAFRGVAVVGVVEDLGERAPAGPSSQDALVVGRGSAPVLVEVAEQA